MTPAVLVRTGKSWRQYLVVTDERVAIVHMTPAMWGGWNFDRVDIQGASEWPGMTRDRIVAWKFQEDDGLTSIVTDLDAVFRERLLARASGGAS